MYRTPRVNQVWMDLDIGNVTDLTPDTGEKVTGADANQHRVVVVHDVRVTTPGIGNEGLRVIVRNVVTGRTSSVWGGSFFESPVTRQGRRNRGYVLVDHWRFR